MPQLADHSDRTEAVRRCLRRALVQAHLQLDDAKREQLVERLASGGQTDMEALQVAIEALIDEERQQHAAGSGIGLATTVRPGAEFSPDESETQEWKEFYLAQHEGWKQFYQDLLRGAVQSGTPAELVKSQLKGIDRLLTLAARINHRPDDALLAGALQAQAGALRELASAVGMLQQTMGHWLASVKEAS